MTSVVIAASKSGCQGVARNVAFARAGAHFIDLAVQELAETFFARVSDHMRQSRS